MAAKDIEDIYELSPLQQGMLFHTLYDADSGLYFEQESYPMRGPIDIPALVRAWCQVVDRHPILRSSFHWEGLEKPVQVVHRDAQLAVDLQDWRRIPDNEQEARLGAYLNADLLRGFDLSKAPLVRLALLHRAEELVHFILSFHHVVLDGWSYRLIMDEVWSYYEVFRDGSRPIVPPVRPYVDFIAWLQQQDLAKAKTFWQGMLNGFGAPTRLGIDRATLEETFAEAEQGEQSIVLSQQSSAALQRLGRQNRLTLNTLVQGAWAIVLSQYSGETDVVFGTVVSGRSATLAGVESMVGLFINTLPVRTHVPPDALPLPWLKDLQAQQFQARNYEYSPLVEIQRCSDVPAGVPLFESLVIFENYPVSDPLQDGSDQPEGGFRSFERSNYPLNLMVTPGARLHLKILYSKLRFDDTAIAQMLGHLQAALEGLIRDPDRRLKDLPLLSGRETRQLLAEWNDTEKLYPQDTTIVSLFEGRAARTPDAQALRWEGEELSYDQLNRRANQLARHLVELGVRPETRVGMCAERSMDAVAGLLAILKAGGAYVPLDPTYPQDRLAYMVEDAGLDVLICRSHFPGSLSRAHIVRLDEWQAADGEHASNLDIRVTQDTLAYVIYTSGSTGQPKGVAVEHRQVLNRLYWMWDAYPFAPGEISCHKTALSFVDSLWELLGPLLQGILTIIIPDEVARDPAALVTALSETRVSRIWLVPSMLHVLLATHPDLGQRLPALTFWVASGEELSAEAFDLFSERHPRAVLYNLYGTSEVWDATWYDPRHEARPDACVPIGRPIANTQAFILDQHLQLVPVGVPGELHVGGAGLARGYLGRPDLTVQKFIPHPFSSERGARLYKTGDLARHRADGSIEFLGRIDRQVKLRGFRIELGEVEAALTRHEAVREAAVLLREDNPGTPRLVAYIVPHPQDQQAEKISGPTLRQFLRRSLPEYMVPSVFVTLSAFPLTHSGKLDRRALPVPDAYRSVLANGYVTPRTPGEEQLADIFGQLLGLEKVGAHDNFFELGGHSLLAIQALSRMREAFHVDITLRAIFETPTVAGLDQLVQEARVRGDTDETPTIVPLSRAAHAMTLLPGGDFDPGGLLGESRGDARQ